MTRNYVEIRVNVENNVKLLRSIASSQDRIEMEKNVKELMNLTTHLQKEDKQPYLTPDLTPDLTQNEIRDIVNDVILELKKTQKKS